MQLVTISLALPPGRLLEVIVLELTNSLSIQAYLVDDEECFGDEFSEVVIGW